MKRDMDLIRAILLASEETLHGRLDAIPEIAGYTEEQVGYHNYLLVDAGLASGVDVFAGEAKGPTWGLTSLTWAGHEFLDAAREPTRWEQAKDVVGKAGGASMAVWTSVLTDIVRSNIRL